MFGLLTVLLMGAFGPAQAQDPNPVYDPVQVLVPEVISVRPHDPTAYTQGLLLYNGSLYESTGGNNDTISPCAKLIRRRAKCCALSTCWQNTTGRV